MTSIRTQTVDGSGPYAYRVHGKDHPRAGPNGKYFEYLGPSGSVDPDELTEEEQAELREEGFALARFRDGVEGDLVSLDLANSLRDDLIDEHGDDVLAPNDDRRETVVRLSEAAPADAARVLGDEATSAQAERQGHGQAELTPGELDRIDFSRENANVPNAMAAKAAIQAAGESDWTQYYDPEAYAEDPAAHYDALTDDQSLGGTGPGSGGRGGSERLDADEGELAGVGAAFDQASKYEQDLMEDAAEAYADGDESAGEFLQDEFGIEEESLAQIESNPDAVEAL